MLAICTWLWGDAYSLSDVDKLKRGIDRNLKQPYRFLLITEADRPFPAGWIVKNLERHWIPDQDRYLLGQKGCFARLRMFDPSWQKYLRVDDRLVCMDLDSIITGGLDAVFDRPESFVILAGANSMNPCPYNGSLMMIRPGAHADIWTDFSIQNVHKSPYYKFPDDQQWISIKAPCAATWVAGRTSGVFAFRKPGWYTREESLPHEARLVVFPGWRSPSKFTHLKWVQDHWR
jgi:hypothetical protein